MGDHNNIGILIDLKQLDGYEVFIYGSGKAGRDLKQRIEDAGPRRKVVAFLDSYKSGRCDGIDIIQIDQYQARPDGMIVIASTFYREITQELTSRGYTRFMIDPQFDYSPMEREKMMSFAIEEKMLDTKDLERFVGNDVYLYGAGGAGRNFKELIERDYSEIKIAGFIDTYKSGTFEGKAVIPIDAYTHVPGNVVIVTSNFSMEICGLLAGKGIQDFFVADSFMYTFMFNPSEQTDSMRDVEKISEMLFSDNDRRLYEFMFQARSYHSGLARSRYLEETNTTVMALVDPAALRSAFPEHTGKQYLDFIKPEVIETVVQAGVYDGSDILEIAAVAPRLKTVYGFEPSGTQYLLPPIFPMIHEKKVILEKYALYDRRTEINFFPSVAGSFISDIMTPVTATRKIETISLDEYCQANGIERVDFICCDIEDAEIHFLEGAQEIIQKSRPQMAISIYHSKTQFIEVPLLLRSMLDGYVFRIGHYSDTLNETAIYAIPEELMTAC